MFLKYLIIMYQIYQNLEYIWDSPILFNPLTLQRCIMRVRFCFFVCNKISLDTLVWLSTYSPASCPHHSCVQDLCVPWSCWLWSQSFLCVLSMLFVSPTLRTTDVSNVWEPQLIHWEKITASYKVIPVPLSPACATKAIFYSVKVHPFILR